MSDVALLDYALDYARRGWHVFLCQPGAKDPIPTRGEASAGHLDATLDELQLAQWCAAYPSANLAIALEASGLMVIDIDPRNGGSEYELACAGEIPYTLKARTGGGGTHLVFADPGVELRGKLDGFAGIDVKRKGYILVEPSHTADDYSWFDIEQPVAELPDWMRELCEVPAYVAPPETSQPLDRALTKREQAYVTAALDHECAMVAAANEGERNNTLARSSFVLGRLVGGRVLERQVAETRLLEAAAKNGTLDTEERTTRRTIARQLDIGIGMPRIPPPADDFHEVRALLASITASNTPLTQCDLYCESSPQVMKLARDPEVLPEARAMLQRVRDVDGPDKVDVVVEMIRAVR